MSGARKTTPAGDLTAVDGGERHIVRDLGCNGAKVRTLCGREFWAAPNDWKAGKQVSRCPKCYSHGGA